MTKKLLMLASAAAVAISGWAAPAGFPCSPAEGTLNMEENSGGMSSIEINVTASINRDASGYATLTRNGQVLKQIPASNVKMFYCVDGYDKTTVGNPHITFFEKASDSPALEEGKYQVIIPRGFFTVVGGEENPQLLYNFEIAETDFVKGTINPSYGSSVGVFKEATITFPAGSKVTASSESPVTIELVGKDSDADAASETLAYTMSITDNVVTLTLENPVTVANSAWITVASNGFSVLMPSGKTRKSAEFMSYFNIIGNESDINGDYSISPEPGTYTHISAVNYAAERNVEGVDSWYAYYKVTIPNGLTMTMNKGFSVKLVNQSGTYSKTFAAMLTPDKNGFYVYDAGNYSEPNDINLAPDTYFVTVTGSLYCAQGNQKVDLKFGPYVVTGQKEVKYEINPKSGSTLESLSEIVLSFPEATTVTWKRTEWASLVYGTIEYDYKGTVVDNNKIVISFDTPLDIPGDYTLTIPSTAISVDGLDFGVLANYIIERPYIKDLNVVAIDGYVKQLTFIPEDDMYDNYWKVVASFEVDTKAELQFEIPSGYDTFAYRMRKIEMPDIDSPGQLNYRRISASDLENAEFTVNTTGIVEGFRVGENTLEISFGSNNTFIQPTLVVAYIDNDLETDGVETVNVEEAAEYYTLQGLKVANPEKGIYIKVVNGNATKVVL